MKANNNKQDFYTERINSYNKFDYMNGHDFEYFCADLLTKNGFVNVEITQEAQALGVKLWDRDKLNEMIGGTNK